MTALKTTRWFSSAQHQPQLVGIYEVQTDYDGMSWSWWDGAHWNGAWSTGQFAEENRNWFEEAGSQGICNTPFKWRGLKEKA